jgi:hypothetical protein
MVEGEGRPRWFQEQVRVEARVLIAEKFDVEL